MNAKITANANPTQVPPGVVFDIRPSMDLPFAPGSFRSGDRLAYSQLDSFGFVNAEAAVDSVRKNKHK